MKTVTPKPSSFYWNVIAGMGWAQATLGGTYPDCDAIKRTFMETYTEKVAAEFSEWYSAKYNELYAAYSVAEKESGNSYGNYGGDDSFGDMLDHVMGLGQEYYNAVMADFRLLNNLDAIESFAYCIPHTMEGMNDYDNLKPEEHINTARASLKAIAETIAAGEALDKDLPIIVETIGRLSLIVVGKFDEATNDLIKDLDYNRFYGYDSCDHGARYANTIFDAKKFMTE